MCSGAVMSWYPGESLRLAALQLDLQLAQLAALLQPQQVGLVLQQQQRRSALLGLVLGLLVPPAELLSEVELGLQVKSQLLCVFKLQHTHIEGEDPASPQETSEL